jgi:hypothetical protein
MTKRLPVEPAQGPFEGYTKGFDYRFDSVAIRRDSYS